VRAAAVAESKFDWALALPDIEESPFSLKCKPTLASTISSSLRGFNQKALDYVSYEELLTFQSGEMDLSFHRREQYFFLGLESTCFSYIPTLFNAVLYSVSL
jgi:hypothetical protein